MFVILLNYRYIFPDIEFKSGNYQIELLVYLFVVSRFIFIFILLLKRVLFQL